MFCPVCGNILIGSKKNGEHNFCTSCAGEDGGLMRVYPHNYFPRGDQFKPAEEHWIATCGYDRRESESSRIEALKRATLIKILNRKDCCPNFRDLESLGGPDSDTRIRIIRNHLMLLIELPKWSDGKEEREIDLLAYDAWLKERE